MKLLQRTTVALAAVAALAAVPVQEARADILPAVGTPTVTPLGGGLFRWDYAIVLSNTQNLSTGDFFVIYDFGPSAQPVLVPAGWTFSSDPNSPVTITGANGSQTATQSNALNWTFVWTGAPVQGADNAPTSLGTFSLFSTSSTPTVAAFGGHGTDRGTNLANVNLTNTQVPTAVPEPASLVLLGTGMLGIVGIARRRNSK